MSELQELKELCGGVTEKMSEGERAHKLLGASNTTLYDAVVRLKGVQKFLQDIPNKKLDLRENQKISTTIQNVLEVRKLFEDLIREKHFTTDLE